MRLQIYVSLPQIHYILLSQSIWWPIKMCLWRWQYIILLLAISQDNYSNHCIYQHNNKFSMYNTSYYLSMVVQWVRTYDPDRYPCPTPSPGLPALAGQSTAILSTLTHYSIYTTYLMSISMLCPILIHPFPLPPALKYMCVHQFSRDQSINYL